MSNQDSNLSPEKLKENEQESEKRVATSPSPVPAENRYSTSARNKNKNPSSADLRCRELIRNLGVEQARKAIMAELGLNTPSPSSSDDHKSEPSSTPPPVPTEKISSTSATNNNMISSSSDLKSYERPSKLGLYTSSPSNSDGHQSEPDSNLPMKRSYKDYVDGDDHKRMEKDVGGCSTDDDDGNPKKYQKNQFLESLSSDVGVQIAFLQCIVGYNEAYGKYPVEDSNALDEFIKGWVQVDVSGDELTEQIQILRKKFKKTERMVGARLDLLKEDDRKAFELGSQIWGTQSGTKSADQQMKNKKNEEAAGQKHDLSMYPFLRDSMKFGEESNFFSVSRLTSPPGGLMDKLGLLGSFKIKELDGKWKKIEDEEVELFLKKVNLMLEQIKVLLEAIKASSSN